MVEIRTDTNLHKIAGKSVVEREDIRYKEYRRQWEENPAKGVVAPFPLHIDLEPTPACNLKCTFCATTYNKYKRGHMSRETWHKILTECGREGLHSLKFTYRGEPLIHKDIVEMVRYAKEVGIMDVYMNTNATLLTDKITRALIAAGIDRISVSFEGYNKETYEKYRVGSSFEKVVENVRRIKKIKDELGTVKPYVRVQCVMVPEMVGHTQDYAEFWAPYVDEVAYLDMKTENVPFDHHSGRSSSWGCPFLWQRLTICADGNILMCPHDIAEWEILGNVHTGTIKAAWLGEKLTSNRNLHTTGMAHGIHPCNRCPLRALEIDKLEGRFSYEKGTLIVQSDRTC